jgi:hypothetical protein
LDKYSDQLLKQYVKNPKSLSNEQLYDLTYLLNQASNGDPKKHNKFIQMQNLI